MKPKANRSTVRTQRVIDIRNAAVTRALAQGQWERIRCGKMLGGRVPRLTYDDEGELSISLSPPLMFPSAFIDLSEYQMALREYGVAMPGQLDIWSSALGKVLNVSWDGRDSVEIVSFRRGAWEAKILQWAPQDKVANEPLAAEKAPTPYLRSSGMLH